MNRLIKPVALAATTLVAADITLITINDEWPDVAYTLMSKLTPSTLSSKEAKKEKNKVVILGSGWSSVSLLKRLDPKTTQLTVISPRSFFFYTPLLAGLTTGTVKSSSITESIRRHTSEFEKDSFLQGNCTSVDFVNKIVNVTGPNNITVKVPYDTLVISVGAETATFGIPGVREYASFMKEVEDGLGVQNKILEQLEVASALFIKEKGTPPSPELLKTLSWIIIGGGPTGVELTAELTDFIKSDVTKYFPHLVQFIKVTLIEASPKILGTFKPEISVIAQQALTNQNASVLLNSAVTNISPNEIVSIKVKDSDGAVKVEHLPYGLCVWAGGIAARPITKLLANTIGGVQSPDPNRPVRGLLVDGKFRVQGLPSSSGVYALGDCSLSGCPPTAQSAFQQGKYLGRMLRDCEFDESKIGGYKNFKLVNFGALAYVGASQGVAELKNVLWDNAPARNLKSSTAEEKEKVLTLKRRNTQTTVVEGTGGWLIWRSLYFSKLLSVRNMVEVCFDWSGVSLFGRDISSAFNLKGGGEGKEKNRPFTCNDRLGVELKQTDTENGEVNLLNSTYTSTRFGFTYAWWTAHNFKHYCSEDDMPIATDMTYIGQEAAYEQVGTKIKEDLLDGNAVVLFAYGLSGSGKTYTVFGPDAADSPDAWFKHRSPHPLWGIFPHLAFDMFNAKKDGWKFSMKYFQNVVDVVRDLMSPMVVEQSYKAGMRKDPDGFMDIQWCGSSNLKSWEDLCEQFQKSNEKKAISPTQFNHQSTRGHCIMTLEIEMPMEGNPSMKQRGRVYVCDLAGTEPAGDIYYAEYKKELVDKDYEYILLGPNKDQRKTKELQDQGKKINLSLSEMAQFFMKMAEAVKKKELVAGKSIPGCNSYFLCKYLKDTMLQARTYLFCAIRPEVKFHSYTFSTLGFATNASVIKLAPKKATIAASPAERKLMAELEEMRKLVASLKNSGGGDSADITALLAKKQKELAASVDGGEEGSSGNTNNDKIMSQQKEEYGRRGISLTYFETDTKHPYLINLDEDPFRSNRFMYLLSLERTVFGPNGDIKPLALSIVKDHCFIENKVQPATELVGEFEGCTLIGGSGETIHNGIKVKKDQRIPLKPFDRVVIGGELLLYRKPGSDPESEPPSASEAVEEYQNCIAKASNEQQRVMEEQMRAFQDEKAKWQAANNEVAEIKENEAEKAEHARAMAAVDREILELLPKTKELKKIVGLLDRDQLSFDVTLQRTDDKLGVPKVKVKVINNATDESIIIDPFEFMKAYSIVKDEMTHLSIALESGRDYEFPEHHDPLMILFDNTFQLGTATVFPEYLIYGLSTDDDEIHQDIKNISAPYNNVGKLEITFIPLASPDAEEDPDYMPEIDDPSDLIGHPWTYKLKIGKATALPIITDMCYIQYTFNGELYTTETVEQNSHNPQFAYEFVHTVDSVNQTFLDYLMQPLEVDVFCSPAVRLPKLKVSTQNQSVVNNLKAGVITGSSVGGDGNNSTHTVDETNEELANLRKRVKALENENVSYKEKVKLYEEEIEVLKKGGEKGGNVGRLKSAKNLDSALNADSAKVAEAEDGAVVVVEKVEEKVESAEPAVAVESAVAAE